MMLSRADKIFFAADQVLAKISPNVSVHAIEPLSNAPRYPLRKASDALAVIDRLPRRDNLRLLADLYHLAVNGDDLSTLHQLTQRIGHVQIADAPGRHEPGTGELDLIGVVERLIAHGYRGHIGLEYAPSTTTADSFGWLTPSAGPPRHPTPR